jgi:hypothetical protein
MRDRDDGFYGVLGALIVMAYLVGLGVVIGAGLERERRAQLAAAAHVASLDARLLTLEHPELGDELLKAEGQVAPDAVEPLTVAAHTTNGGSHGI